MAKTPPVRSIPHSMKPVSDKAPEKLNDGTATTVSIVMFICILAIGGAISYYLTSKYSSGLSAQKNAIHESVLSSSDSLILAAADEDISAEIERVHSDGSSVSSFVRGNYYLIVATFINEKNAKEYADKLSAQGVINNIIMEDRDRTDFYRISIAQSEDKEKLRTKRLEYIAKYNGDAWVLTK